MVALPFSLRGFGGCLGTHFHSALTVEEESMEKYIYACVCVCCGGMGAVMG